MAKNFTKILCAFLAFVMCLGTVPAFAIGTAEAEAKVSIGASSINKVAGDLVDDYVDVTLSVPGQNMDLSSDIVFIIGAGPASNYDYIVNMIHKMLVAVDGTPTKIKIGMVGFADTTEQETVLNLTEMVDTVPGNTVSEYRNISEEDIAKLLAETPELANDMEFVIARALEKAAAVYNGVNLESSLITARDMLAADTTVPADRKHMIVISTGLTYWFDADNGQGSCIVRNNNRGVPQHCDNTRWLEARHQGTATNVYGYFIPSAYTNDADSYVTAWLEYWEDIVSWIEKDQNDYVYTVRDTYGAFTKRLNSRLIVDKDDLALVKKDANGNYQLAPYATGTDDVIGENEQHALGYERAQYEAWVVYNQMQTPIGESFETVLKDESGNKITVNGMGFNCYAIAIGKTPAPGNETTWLEANQIGYNFMHMLGGENTVNYNSGDLSFFKSIENKILYTCAAGSYVVDYIGKNENGNFEFIENAEYIKLVVGGVEYKTENAVGPRMDEWELANSSYDFYAPDSTSEDGWADTPTFWLDYFYGDGETTERFVWTFGEDVSLDNLAALTYKLYLTDKQTAYGTYIVPTNNSATLYPVGGTPQDFPVPYVDYDVKYDVDIVIALGSGIAQYDADNAKGYTHTYDSIVSLVEPLVNQGIKVKLGLIAVEHYDDVAMELTVLTKGNYKTVITDGLNAIQQMPAGPTNLHGNIVAAKEMLDADTSVPAENKFFYVFATGRTYNYDNAKGVPTTIINKVSISGKTYYYWGHYLWQSQRGGHTSLYMIPDRYNNDFSAYWADVEKWVDADKDTYAYSFTEAYDETNPQWYNTFAAANTTDLKAHKIASSRFGWLLTDLNNKKLDAIGSGSNPQNALNYERAQYEAYQTYQEMIKAGYNCEAICTETPNYQNGSEYIKDGAKYTGTSTIQLGHSFMDFLNGGEAKVLFDYTRDENGNLVSAATVFAITDYFAPIDQSKLVKSDKVTKTLSFSEHTVDVTASTGDIASFIVEAEGDGLTYAWYYKTSKMSEFELSSFTGNEYNAVMSGTYDEQQIYCVVTDQYGNTQTTETVALTLE